MVTIAAFLLGLVAGLIAFALFLPSLNKRAQARHQLEMERHERMIGDLRQERAEDRETNRRLRHDLAINTPANFEATQDERDQAIVERDRLRADLRQVSAELADRDRSLREARLAIHDIRVQLERDRIVASGGDTDGYPAGVAPSSESIVDRAVGDTYGSEAESLVASVESDGSAEAAGLAEPSVEDELGDYPASLAVDGADFDGTDEHDGAGFDGTDEHDGAGFDGTEGHDGAGFDGGLGGYEAEGAVERSLGDEVLVDDDEREGEPSTVFFGDYPLGGTTTS